MNPTKKQQLDDLVRQVQKKWGAKALQPAREAGPATTRALPTSHPVLDYLTGTGGLPRGLMTEFIGASTAGIHTLVFTVITHLQNSGEGVVYFDLPHAFDPDYASARGVALSDLLLVRPHSATEAFDIALDLVSLKVAGLIVWDSLPYLLEEPNGPTLLDSAFRRLPSLLAASPTVFLILSPFLMGSYPPQAAAVAHHAALRLLFQDTIWSHDHGELIGYETEGRVLKNRFGPEGVRGIISVRL